MSSRSLSCVLYLPKRARDAGAHDSLVALLCRLVAYPLGRLTAAVLPIRHYDLPKFLGGGQFSFNPGR